jgi:peptide/nickel transport system ATP-binding protein
MSDSTPILEARALTKYFAGAASLPFRKAAPIRAVDGVSFSVRRGETFAVVGESGCGKSTLARLLLRLIEPTSGTVHYDGGDVTHAGASGLRRLRREMQIVFQDPFSSLNPRMTVGQLIGEPFAVHRIAAGRARDAQVAELLRRVGLLPEHARRYPHEFSGGQRQRIGIARALACAPRLLIGDEPVSALDVSIRAQIVNLLEDLKREFDLTLVLVAHDLALIRHTCDRVAVMYLGEIVELGDAERVFEHPAHPYTRALLAAIPVPVPAARGRRQLPQGDPPSPAAPPPGCRFHPRCPHAEPICREQRPQLIERGRGQFAACHLAGRLPAAVSAIAHAKGDAGRRRLAIYHQRPQSGAASR